jgi:hypothetical protein
MVVSTFVAVAWGSRERRAHVARARHPIKRGGGVAEGEGVGGVRASAALFSHLSTFCKGGICEGRCEVPARAGARSTGERWCVVVLARALPHARGAAHKNCRQRRYASELPPSTYSKSWKVGFARRSEARARARCARWAGGGAGSDARLPLRETRRVQGPRNGSSAKASVAALGAAHGVERPPPRGRARGRAAARGRAGGGSVSGRRSAQAAPYPLARARRRTKPSCRLLIAPQRPLPTHCLAVPAFQQQLTRFAAGTATFNRESRRISREEVGTSCSSPLARARRRWKAAVDVATPSSAHCPPTA